MITALDHSLTQLDQRLQHWARWYLSQYDDGLGYAKIPWDTLMLGQCQNTPAQSQVPRWDEQAEHTAQVLRALRQRAPALATVIYAHYLLPGSGKQHAQHIGISYASFRQQLKNARIWLIAWYIAQGKRI